MNGGRRDPPGVPSLRNQLGVLAALMALLLLSAGSALLPMGTLNTVANLGIAALKALLVMIFFMRLRSDSPLLRAVAGAGFAWLSLLILLSMADYLTRMPLAPPR